MRDRWLVLSIVEGPALQAPTLVLPDPSQNVEWIVAQPRKLVKSGRKQNAPVEEVGLWRGARRHQIFPD